MPRAVREGPFIARNASKKRKKCCNYDTDDNYDSDAVTLIIVSKCLNYDVFFLNQHIVFFGSCLLLHLICLNLLVLG